MLRDTVAELLLQRLGKRTDLLSAVITEMQYVQEFILEQHHWLPWFLESEWATSTTIVGEERVRVPDDFLGEIEDNHLWVKAVSDTTWTKVTKEPYDIAYERYSGSGTPEVYSLSGEYFLLRPVPDQIFSLRMRYYNAAEVLSSNIENLWLKYASDVMMGEVGQIMAGRYIQNPALEAQFKTDAERAWDRLYRQHIGREQMNSAPSMGDE
jgi:hypothetical protein